VKIEIKEVSSVLRELTLTIDAETATKDYMTVLGGFKKMASIPGFRKGKAPMKMVETMYGEYAKDEFYNKKLTGYYRQALDEKEENPVNMGEAQDFEWNKGEDLVVTFKYEVRPEVKVDNFKGLEIPYEAVEFTDTMIDDTLEDFRRQMATEEDADEVQTGDTVSAKIQFVTEDDAEATEFHRTFVIGDNIYSSQVDVALIGQKVGALVKTVLFDAESKAAAEEEEMGSDVIDREVQMKILEIKRKVLPELNDEFAKDMEYDTLEDMRAKIAEQLQIKLKQDNENNRRENIVKALLEANPFDLPESMIENYAKSIAEPQAKQYKMDVEQLIPIFRVMAEHNMKGYYLMDALIKQENIQVTDEERDAAIKEAAANLQIDEEKYRELYKKQIESEDFNRAIKEKKLLDFIAENNTFVPYPAKDAEEGETVSQNKE